MPVENMDLTGTINVSDFRMQLGSYSLSADKSQLIIPYISFGTPDTVADVVVYDYSIDDGVSWEAMTPSLDTVLTSLDFTEVGVSQEFKWEIKSDIDTAMYNTSIRIRFQANNGALDTLMTMYGVYLSKEVIDMLAVTQTLPFPEDYMGVPGNSLMDKAPKAQ